MCRPVVVPLIDSLFSARAIPLLVEIARRCDVAMHLVDLNPEESTSPAGAEGFRRHPSQGQQERRTRAMRDGYFENVARQLGEVLGSARVRTAVREGAAAPALTSYAREQSAGLIVIAIENRDRAGERETRLLAEKIARESGVPIFLIATNKGETRGTFISAMDGTEQSRDGLQTALVVARVCGAEELEVRALPDEPFTPVANGSAPRPNPAPALPR